jgi:hypothetical protein
MNDEERALRAAEVARKMAVLALSEASRSRIRDVLRFLRDRLTA